MYDTIIAPVTPLSPSGVGIIRISGSSVPEIAKSLFGCLPKPRYATLASLQNKEGELLDQGLLLFFPKPHSFTGEDVLEFQGHGSPVMLKKIIETFLKFPNIRLAGPGEFSQRAFLNGKLDLLQAEAIADLIEAKHEHAAKAALKNLEGAFSKRVNELGTRLLALRVQVEAQIDFSEDVDWDFSELVLFKTQLTSLEAETSKLYSLAQQSLQQSGHFEIALVGNPNAGKSSLFNTLLGELRALVTHVPGTTRDTLREQLHLEERTVWLTDTAGLRKSNDFIEKMGIAQSHKALKRADLVLLVLDGAALNENSHETLEKYEKLVKLAQKLNKEAHFLTVVNKQDVLPEAFNLPPSLQHAILISAKTGKGISTLKQYLLSYLQKLNQLTVFSVRQRHLTALKQALNGLKSACKLLENSHFLLDQLAAELHYAQTSLAELTGLVSSEQLLAKIFSSFCIGK